VYGGQELSARTSCECIRRECACIHCKSVVVFLVLMRENWTVFWSTPEEKTAFPSGLTERVRTSAPCAWKECN